MTSETLAYFTLGGLAIALLASIYTDIRYRLIYNTIPLILFILPTLFIVILGPAACSVSDAFSGNK
ncbi:hypothetical protein [Sphingorhabdus sp.]|jgi:hypothetical protein|uniref:hypothetical protein n=1 Tax=Sphingorhabdus sp. TaxID=1902408 RepID=UPI0038FD30A5